LLAAPVALAAVWAFFHSDSFSQPPETESQNVIWSASPGEWVLFGADYTQLVGHYFKPSALRKFADKTVFFVRSPIKPPALGAYQDDLLVFDCKNKLSTNAESTVYNIAGEIISHFRTAEPEALNPAAFKPTPAGIVLSTAEQLACDESLTTPLGDQVKNAKLTFFSVTHTGDGDMYYGPAKKGSESPVAPVPYAPSAESPLPYLREVLVVTKFFQDHSLADIFPKKPLLNYPHSYRSLAQVVQINCTYKKGQSPIMDSFDAQGNLVYLSIGGTIDSNEGTILRNLMSRVCVGG
jgi:hypothetical protein